MKETTLLTSKHILLFDGVKIDDYLKKNFCGKVFMNIEEFIYHQPSLSKGKLLYLCSKNVATFFSKMKQIITKNFGSIFLVEEYCKNYESSSVNLISIGEVPINIHNVGVFFRKLFNSNKNFYKNIVEEHEFQSLTISDKPGSSYRKGIYLTNVEKNNDDEIMFKLLRCSTDLSGPTDNFRKTDREVVEKVDTVRRYFFKNGAELNHVLAQTYHNVKHNGKERKAKISEHSDKTKDMPQNGLIAFCTFYEDHFANNKSYQKSGYDICYRGSGSKLNSVLTKLRFRLKKEVTDDFFTKKFEITLYPNSVFIMPLSTNRLYTHEIIPSNLNINKLPTRMGYVIRCSNTDVVYKNNKTYIVKDKKYIELEQPTKEGVKELKQLYFIENTSAKKVNYENFYFSMNKGDYMKPLI